MQPEPSNRAIAEPGSSTDTPSPTGRKHYAGLTNCQKKLPSLLVLSHQIPQTVYAGCIVLHRLLNSYPPEKLLVIGSQPHPNASLLDCRYEVLQPPFQRLNRTRFARLKRSLETFGLFPRVPLRAIDVLLKTFEPQVILSVMEGPYSEAAARLARRNGWPLVLIVHDRQDLFECVYPWANRSQMQWHASIYRAAARRLCVSFEMEQYWRGVCGEPGEVLYPNRSEEVVPRPPERSMQLVQPPLLWIGFAGSLAYGYGTQLVRLANAIRGSAVRIRVYADIAGLDSSLMHGLTDVIEWRGFITPAERLWNKVKDECDAVMLPYPWHQGAARADLYRTSFPSKLPEYLALGMPVMIMGPEYAAGMRWGLRNQEAVFTITEDQPSEWLAALEEIRTSPERRTNLARAALAAGLRDFDPVSIRNRFEAILWDAARSSGNRVCAQSSEPESSAARSGRISQAI